MYQLDCCFGEVPAVIRLSFGSSLVAAAERIQPKMVKYLLEVVSSLQVLDVQVHRLNVQFRTQKSSGHKSFVVVT